MAADLARLPNPDCTPNFAATRMCRIWVVRGAGWQARFRSERFRRDDSRPWEWDVKRMAASIVLAGRDVRP